jgi:hypothetical protein
MGMKNRLILRRKYRDLLVEELVDAFSGVGEFEFKPLFTSIYANLRERKAAHGGEDMLRLRLYEKLQWLVQSGGVEKTGKFYRGNSKMLGPLREQIAANQERELLKDAPGVTAEA